MAGREAEDPVAFAWLARLFGLALALYVRLVTATMRPHGPPPFGGRAVFAMWHESNLVALCAALKLRDDRNMVSFSTRGFRGIVVNTLLRSLGASVVTLPEPGEHAEAAGLAREMARIGREGSSLVVSCDGPLGPPRLAKPGVLIVARESSLPIQPWAFAIRPALRLNRRWDRQLLPLPFCRLWVEQEDQIIVGERDRIKPHLAGLQAALDRVADRADRRMAR